VEFEIVGLWNMAGWLDLGCSGQGRYCGSANLDDMNLPPLLHRLAVGKISETSNQILMGIIDIGNP
jgi:hypothetical protein